MKVIVVFAAVAIALSLGTVFAERPVVAWYVVAKHLNLTDFFEKAEAYRPDVVLLTVYAEDDMVPFNGTGFPLEEVVDRLHTQGIRVFYSFSLFSRSALPFEAYMELNESGIPFEELNISVARYARFLREQRTDDVFDYWRERGLDPETIPISERKPVDGYYTEPGHYTSINPLFRPYRVFMKKVIGEIVERKRPDGLAIDHGRFFTFDEGFNTDIREWMMEKKGVDIGNYTPRPMFQIQEWAEADRAYYDGRAELVAEAVSDILSGFDFPVWGTTMGMTEPARSNGQYVELQARNYQKLLLMAYDTDTMEVERNVRATGGNGSVILGVFPFENISQALENIETGLRAGARGVYLLGYRFPAEVHEKLLRIRGL